MGTYWILCECSLLFKCEPHSGGRPHTANIDWPTSTRLWRQYSHITMMWQFWPTYCGMTRLPAIIIRSLGRDLLNPISC